MIELIVVVLMSSFGISSRMVSMVLAILRVSPIPRNEYMI